MKIKISILVILLLSILSIGQENFLHNKPVEPLQNIFITHTIFPLHNSDSSRVDFNYYIPHNFLIYTRDTDTSYKAQCEITIELKNLNTNRTEIRKIQKREFKKSNINNITIENQSYLSGILSFNLVAGKYRIFFEVKDIESARSYKDNRTEFEITSTQKPFSDLLFIEQIDTAKLLSSKIYNVSYGNTVPFEKKFYVYLELDNITFPQTIPRVELYNLTENRKENIQVTQNPKIIYSRRLLPNLDGEYYSFEENNTYNGVLFFLPLNQLNIGDYELVIKFDDEEKIRKTFQVKWIDIPRSLRDFRLAIDLLEYIATGEDIREMKIINIKAAREKFEAFWKKLDPTPETAYNEAMAEYYRRADYATEQYTTIKGEIGAKTDRGKIYMLYGAPSSTERTILPRKTPKEIWIYQRLAKKFIFEDKNFDGNYKLIGIENL